jgi:hypothetical protein
MHYLKKNKKKDYKKRTRPSCGSGKPGPTPSPMKQRPALGLFYLFI